MLASVRAARVLFARPLRFPAVLLAAGDSKSPGEAFSVDPSPKSRGGPAKAKEWSWKDMNAPHSSADAAPEETEAPPPPPPIRSAPGVAFQREFKPSPGESSGTDPYPARAAAGAATAAGAKRGEWSWKALNRPHSAAGGNPEDEEQAEEDKKAAASTEPQREFRPSPGEQFGTPPHPKAKAPEGKKDGGEWSWSDMNAPHSKK